MSGNGNVPGVQLCRLEQHVAQFFIVQFYKAMVDLVSSKQAMSSLEIAEVTGKQHAHIMRDIKNLLNQGVNQSNFGLVEYFDKKGEKRPCYNLTPKGVLILASGYNPLLREKIINRLEELETKNRKEDDYYIDTSNVTRKDLAAVILESEEDLKAQDKIIEEQKVQIKELKEKLEQEQKEKIEKRFEKVENAIIRLAELMATSRIQPPIPVKKPETGLPLFPNEKPQPREIANGKIRPSIAKPLHPGTYLVSEVRFTMMNESGINLRSRDIFRWLRREGWVSSENTSYNKPSPMAIKNGWMLPVIGNGRRITDKMHFTPRFTESGYRKFVETIMKKGGLL